MSSIFYIFRLLWPFLKEWVLGGISLKEGMKTQKRKVLLLFFVSGLILSLFFLVPRYLVLVKEHHDLETSATGSHAKDPEPQSPQQNQKATENPKPTNTETCGAIEVAVTQVPSAPTPDPAVTSKPIRHPHVVSKPVVYADNISDKRRKSYQDFFEHQVDR